MSGGGDFSIGTATDPDHLEGIIAGGQLPPSPARKADGPGDWMKKNLFSSAGNTITTIILSLIHI